MYVFYEVSVLRERIHPQLSLTGCIPKLLEAVYIMGDALIFLEEGMTCLPS